MKKKIIPIALVLVAAAATLTWWTHFRNSGEDPDLIFVSGNIEATEVDLAFRIGGQIELFPLEEGDRVKAGEPVAELDTDTLKALRGAARAAIAAAKAQLDELEKGPRVEEIEMARARLKAAKSRLKNAKSEYDRHKPLYNGGAISASTIDAREMALRVARAELDSAAERLRELEAGTREEKKRAARATLERARWELKKIELDIEHSVVCSPINGVVMLKSNEVGEVVLPGATIGTVARVDEVWLKGYVGEKYLGKLKLGQEVEVTTDSFPGKIHRGRVTFISPKAEFTPKNVQTLEERIKQVYRVKVTIPNPDRELKIGMPAEGYILLDTRPVPAGGSRPKGSPAS
jgi:HlyD family secretion protein